MFYEILMCSDYGTFKCVAELTDVEVEFIKEYMYEYFDDGNYSNGNVLNIHPEICHIHQTNLQEEINEWLVEKVIDNMLLWFAFYDLSDDE